MKKRLLLTCLSLLLLLIITPIMVVAYLYLSADMAMPPLTIDRHDYATRTAGDTTYCRTSYLHQDTTQLWELYLQGSGEVRGATQGALTASLMRYQEEVFMEQIRQLIPSESYLSFLRVMLISFNRRLGKHIPLEYRQEIAAMAQWCTAEYNAIGTPYERQLNYHAAHDIGHTMQQYMLVGCSSFAAWGDDTADGELWVGRNFDFYVGNDFARNKIIFFVSPDKGYRYTSVAWAGMVGVLSGMNERGITVTINAAKGAIPTSAATPISILTRQILQYAATIDEANAIAAQHQTFVSESILIGSAAEGRAAIIEKTPKQQSLYTQEASPVRCTNHYQSAAYQDDPYNKENIATSDSQYRFERLSELLADTAYAPLDQTAAAAILRNRHGKGGEDIGVGNEMTINQSIAHHSVIFAPASYRMWVSTAPWQSGAMVCYDLREFFAHGTPPRRARTDDIAADSLFMQRHYAPLLQWRDAITNIKQAINDGNEISPDFEQRFVALNPHHYYTHRLLGDYYAERDDEAHATTHYLRALDCAIPYESERQELIELTNQ